MYISGLSHTSTAGKDRAMHVLIIPSEAYFADESAMSGMFQRHQAHALKRAGYNVGVLSLHFRPLSQLKKGVFGWPRGIEAGDDGHGVHVVFYHGWSYARVLPWLNIRLSLKAGEALFEKYVGEYGMPDIVHAHNALCAGVIANRIMNKHGVKYVITEHSSEYAAGTIPAFAVPLITRVFNEAAAVLTVSPSLGKILKGIFGDFIHCVDWIPNVLDKLFEENTSFRTREKGRREVFTFLSIGHLDRNKGQDILLSAFAKKFKGKKNVALRVGGDGPLRKELEKRTHELGIGEQTSFLGFLGRNEVLREMNDCDAFVMSSAHETFGVVLVEALACGKPIVSTKSGGPECIINDNNGILVRFRNADTLSDGMYEMYYNINTYDNEWIRRDCIGRFGEKAVVSALASIYRTVSAGDRTVRGHL